MRGFVPGVGHAVGRGAETFHLAVQKNVGHGRIGRQADADHRVARSMQAVHNAAQRGAGQSGQTGAAFWLAGHGQTGHDIRSGPGLGIEKVSLGNSRAGIRLQSPPVHGRGAQINGQRQFPPCLRAQGALRRNLANFRREILRRQFQRQHAVRFGIRPGSGRSWNLTATSQPPARFQLPR